MFNKVTLVGRISTDLELRYTGSNKAYCRFNLAVNRMNEGTDFIPVTVWGKPAENLVSYQNKGSLILVDGSISMNNYTDKDGNNRTSFEVMTSNVQFLGNKKTIDETTISQAESDPYKEMSEQINEEIDLEDLDEDDLERELELAMDEDFIEED